VHLNIAVVFLSEEAGGVEQANQAVAKALEGAGGLARAVADLVIADILFV
jgi:hypothetical protein